MILAEGDDLIFSRTLDEQGRDHFGRTCPGPKKVLCIINRSDKMRLLVHLDGNCDVLSTEHIPDVFSGTGETGTKAVSMEQKPEKAEVRPLSAMVYVIS